MMRLVMSMSLKYEPASEPLHMWVVYHDAIGDVGQIQVEPVLDVPAQTSS